MTRKLEARGTNTERQGNSMHSLNPGWDWTRLLQVTGDSYKMTIYLKEAVKVHAVSLRRSRVLAR